jgi:SET domain-containing protein
MATSVQQLCNNASLVRGWETIQNVADLHVAVCCSVLQCVATAHGCETACCSMLQSVAVCCSMLQGVAHGYQMFVGD